MGPEQAETAPPIRLHRVADLTPALMAELASLGYRAVRDPELVIYVPDSAPVTLAAAAPHTEGGSGGPEG